MAAAPALELLSFDARYLAALRRGEPETETERLGCSLFPDEEGTETYGMARYEAENFLLQPIPR